MLMVFHCEQLKCTEVGRMAQQLYSSQVKEQLLSRSRKLSVDLSVMLANI